MWGPKGDRQREIFIDADSQHPKVIAKNALHLMATKPGNTRSWWGHNSGKFDTLFLLEAIKELGWKARAHIAGGRIITLKVSGPHGEFEIHDSYAVVSSTLKRAAEGWRLNTAKLFTQDDYSQDIRTWSIERLVAGCYADCEIVLELLERVETMFEEHGGKLKATASASALSVLTKAVPLFDTISPVVNTWARNAFCGGRVEVYRHTPQYPLTEWDINSSYPHSMTQTLPWAHEVFATGALAQKAFENGKLGVVEATVYSPDCYLPVLPWRHQKHGGIYFPTGEWRGYFDSEELRYAVECGARIVALHSMQVFSSENRFQDYVSSFFALKSESEGAEREFYKLCLNGAYGKFAQKPEREELVIYEDQETAIDEAFLPKHKNRFRFLNSRDCRYVAIISEIWPRQTHYALAGAITAQSRIALHRYLSAAVAIAYTDTDSIHASRRSEMGRFANDALGALKVELDDYSGVYAAPKIYGLTENKPGGKEHYASKGFPVSKEVFHRVLAGEVIETHRIHLAKRQVKGDNTVRRTLAARSWKGLSTKRRPIGGPDGDTTPWSVNQLMQDEHLLAVSPLAKWQCAA